MQPELYEPGSMVRNKKTGKIMRISHIEIRRAQTLYAVDGWFGGCEGYTLYPAQQIEPIPETSRYLVMKAVSSKAI